MSGVVVCDYGADNTRSVRVALADLGHESTLSSDPDLLENAGLVILPGVGSARQAMTHLNETGAAEAIRSRFSRGLTILGICLGMQLALEYSEEDDGVRTLGLLSGTVRRIEAVRVPRLGWATVEPWGGSYYFAHSYACESPTAVARSEGVTAAVESGAFLGVQFHPEKSGDAGRRWLATCLSPV